MVSPIYSLNITQRITEIKNIHSTSIIIAIDAALSSDEKIGGISVEKGPIKPAAGINKKNDGVGDYSIKGYVGPNGLNLMEYNTDLNFISAMANTIAKGINEGLK